MMTLPLKKQCYTYADYLEWDEDRHTELIDGEIFILNTPDLVHQKISGELVFQIMNYLEGKNYQLFFTLSVRLHPAKDNSDDTVLIPDIIVCDPSKLDKRGCNGAPDVVIEILSPSTARHDKVLKFNKYQDAGVREYWIVDPDTQSVQACVLENGRYMLSSYDDTGTAPITVLPGCEIDLRTVFAG